MPHPIISLPWDKLNQMAYALNDQYSGVAVDFFRSAIMKMMLEALASFEVSIEQLMGRPYGLHSCLDQVALTLPFSDEELHLLTQAGYDLKRKSAEEIGALFQQAYANLGFLHLDVGVDGALPKTLELGALKAIRSNEWGAYLLTHVLDKETGVWMACPPSPLL